MESTRTPRESGRRTILSRPRSRTYRKKQSIVKRVASTLRHRRSQLHFMYQNALIEMAESKLNLPHEGQPGLIYAVSQIPSGHSRQSLIDVFDDVVANMSVTTKKSSSQKSWDTYLTSHDSNSTHSADLLTGEYDSPEDFDRYLTWQPLKPLPIRPSSKADGKPHKAAELTWSPPRTPSIASNASLIDLDTPPSRGPPTTPDVQSSDFDELFFGGVSEALTSPTLLPSQLLAPLDASIFPQPLKFEDSPFPVLGGLKLNASIPATPKKTLQRMAVHSSLKLDTQQPARQVTLLSPTCSAVETPTSAQPGCLIPRKSVPETPIKLNISQQGLSPETPTIYRPYRPAVPSPSLLPVPIRPTDSLLDDMNDEIDRVMASFRPMFPSKKPIRQEPATSPRQAAATEPPSTPAMSSFPLPPSHRIPARTTSRTATTMRLTIPSSQQPSSTPTPALHSSSSFRSRLGASTLQALLTAADNAPPSPTLPLAEPYSWHRWVDCARDQDSETEEQEHQRRWRQKRREERRVMQGE